MASNENARPILRLHHLGVVVKDIQSFAAAYTRTFGFQERTGVVHDPLQTARVQFLNLPGDQVLLEFVSPDGPESALAGAVRKQEGLNHICFSTPDLESACRVLRERGLLLIRPPTPAVAFEGRKIVWFADKSGILYELVEQGAEGAL